MSRESSSLPAAFRSASSIAVAAFIACSAFAGAAHGQTLQELYNAARGYDATYLSARALADSAPYRAEQAKALLRPNVALSSAATHTQTEPPSGVERTTNALSASLTGRQPLFNRSNSVTVEQAQKSLDSSRADLDTAEQDLIVRVAQAYFDVLAAYDALGTTQASKAAITEQLAAAKRNFEVGTATITDTREAQARSDLATAQEIAANNDLRTKRITLDLLVGRSDVTPRPLKTPVVLPQDLLSQDVTTWVNQAQAVHPAVRRAQLALDVAQLETQKARAGHLPTVDLVGSFGPNRQTGSGAALSAAGPGTTTSASIGIQLNLPLYTGGSVQNRIKETLVLEDKSREDLDAAKRAVSQTTRQVYSSLESGRAQVNALEAAESSSLLALEATQLGYRVGVRVNIDVLNSQTQLFTTRQNLAKARYDVLTGSLRLRQAAGQLRPEDILLIERLLSPTP
ncbi:TolC family outer membrane protein [soil metagenome]